MSKILGIDFGTTNSCMAVWENGEAVIIPNAEGSRVTPSVVAFGNSDEVLVGESAKRQAVTNPKNTIFSVKRLLGRSFTEIKDNLKLYPFDVAEGKNGDVNIIMNDKNYSPVEIATFILHKLKSDAELYLGEKVHKAVITVPAYFDDLERQAIYNTGKMADLDIIGIINEPTSAALAYGLDKDSQNIVAVHDLGGGTFDISLLNLNGNDFEVLATRGNTSLGGVDFDNEIIAFLTKEFKNKYNIDLNDDPQALQRLTDAAESAKCELSSTKSTEINLPFISVNDTGPLHLTQKLSRRKLEELTEHLIDETNEPFAGCMVDSKLAFQDIDEVLLVGGMTRMPRIIRNIKSKFHEKVLQSINPDEVVAIGAAIHGASLSGAIDDLVLLDVTPMSLGIETAGGIFTKLIERNSAIPTNINEVFTTESDNQSSVTINVLQGESDLAKKNKSLGHFQLSGIDPEEKGLPHIEVIFDINANGILNVSAVDLKTGRSKEIKISSGPTLIE